MFIISTPKDFKIGATIPVKINDLPATLTWRDQATLVIDQNDPRQIMQIAGDSEMLRFICGDARDGKQKLKIEGLIT